MYVPKHFDAPDQAWCHALIERESFALLVSTGGDGAPFATHLPLLLDGDRGPRGTLVGHLARANPHGLRHQIVSRPTKTAAGPRRSRLSR